MNKELINKVVFGNASKVLQKIAPDSIDLVLTDPPYFLLTKPNGDEKGDFNTHKTVKPLAICEYIIKLTTFSEDAIVLDPFVGSGTTVVTAKKSRRKFIGIDINQEYIEIAQKRLKALESKQCKHCKTDSRKTQLRLPNQSSNYAREERKQQSKKLINNPYAM